MKKFYKIIEQQINCNCCTDQNIIRILDCVDELSLKYGVSKSNILDLLDSEYKGLKITYKIYKRNGIIMIITPLQIKTFSETSKVKVRDRKKIFFYDPKNTYGEFSNFYSKNQNKTFRLVIDNIEWKSTEHYFQAQKFLGPSSTEKSREYAELIKNAKTPSISKILAAQKTGGGYRWRTNLNSIIEQYKDVKIRKDWEDVKEDIMKKALLEKFSQNEKLKEVLLKTEFAILYEHTSRDKYWADGGDGSGKNRLEYLLMIIRDELF